MEFDALVDEAFEFEGWDFSVFGCRVCEESTPWSYVCLAVEAAEAASSMVDMGTGGGEQLVDLLEILGDRAPRRIAATESWEPNVPIARRSLEPRGVTVVPFSDDSDLPLADDEFNLAINKHESFNPTELHRILQPSSRFLTQQVGGRDLSEINELLGAPPLDYADWSLEAAVQELRQCGFHTERAKEAMLETSFTDIGALVGFLRVVEWQIPDFSVDRYREKLRSVHQRMQDRGPLVVHGHRFLIQARNQEKPG